MIGIDTNVLVRYIVQDDIEQASKAAALLKSKCTREQPAWINKIVLCELVWVLERAYKSPRDEIANVLEAITQTAEFQIEDLGCVWAALGAYRRQDTDFADALIAATNLARGCSTTVTFDRKATRLSGMSLLTEK